ASSQGLPEPCLRSPSLTVNASSWLFMSARRFGITASCAALYGTSPQSPTAYSKVLSLRPPFAPTATPTATAAHTTTASVIHKDLRIRSLPLLAGQNRSPARKHGREGDVGCGTVNDWWRRG